MRWNAGAPAAGGWRTEAAFVQTASSLACVGLPIPNCLSGGQGGALKVWHQHTTYHPPGRVVGMVRVGGLDPSQSGAFAEGSVYFPT